MTRRRLCALCGVGLVRSWREASKYCSPSCRVRAQWQQKREAQMAADLREEARVSVLYERAVAERQRTRFGCW